MSGDAVIGPPIKKCPGVNTDRSRGLEEMEVRGREFNIASMSIITVSNSSYVKSALTLLLRRSRGLSHRPER